MFKIGYSTIFIIFLCCSESLSFSASDVSNLYSQYSMKRSKWAENMQVYSQDFFTKLSQTTMMSRIKNFKKILGAGSGGFVFLASYLLPNSSTRKYIDVSVKILPDDSHSSAFYQNLILAKMTGNMDVDKFNSSLRRPYSIDESEKRLEVNFTGEENIYRSNINQFFEMQASNIMALPENGSKVKSFKVTVLVTSPGERNMVGILFNNNTTKTQNSKVMFRYILELARGAMNINMQRILHGDIKPDNVILVRYADKKLHPEYIDFDLSLDSTEESLINSDNRYTRNYRPPWLNLIEVADESADSKQKKKTKQVYSYDRKFREDMWALGKTIEEILSKNMKFLDTDNEGIIMAYSYIKQHVFGALSKGVNALPTTTDFYNFLAQVNEEEKQKVSAKAKNSKGFGAQINQSAKPQVVQAKSKVNHRNRQNKMESSVKVNNELREKINQQVGK